MTDEATDLLTTLTDQPSTPPGYHPDDTFTLWCYEWDDRRGLSGSVGPAYSYDGGLVTLPGHVFAQRLCDPLEQARRYGRPVARIEIRRDRETIATLTEDQAWDLVAAAGPWTVYADYEDGVTETEYRTKSEAHSAAHSAAQSSGGGTPRPDYVAVRDCLGREEWSDESEQHHQERITPMTEHPYLLIVSQHGTPLYAEGFDTIARARDRVADLATYPDLTTVLWGGTMDGSIPPAPYYDADVLARRLAWDELTTA